MAKQQKRYRWKCRWTNDKGCFHADFEGYFLKSRPFTCPKRCALAGKKHVQIHGWGRWGYPPFEKDWREDFISIYEISPSGKEKRIGNYNKVLGIETSNSA